MQENDDQVRPVPYPAANLTEHPERVLLLNPPIYDTRLPWSQFQQPVLLLKLATLLKSEGKDVKLIDTRYVARGKHLPRERVAVLDMDGIRLNKWRFGLSKPVLTRALRDLALSRWQPDEIYVECLTSFWWEGAAEAVGVTKQQFPQARVILVGPYASLAPEHAAQYTAADEIHSEIWPNLAALPVDLSLYPEPPAFAYLTLGTGQLTPEDVVDEIATKVAVSRRRLRSFAFVEQIREPQTIAHYLTVLNAIIERKLDVTLYALGSISPADFVEYPDLAGLMKLAGYTQITFADDRDAPYDPAAVAEWIEACRRAATACHSVAECVKHFETVCR